MRRSYKSLYRKMNKGQRKNGGKKLGFLVLILIIAAAVITIIFLFQSNIINFSRQSGIIATTSSVNVEDTKRNPTVTFRTNAGTWYNEITGVSRDNFTYETDIQSYSPLDSNRKQFIRINTLKSDINSISYEVRDISDGTLMERTEVDYVSDGEGTRAELNIKNLLNPNQKYQLQIRVEYKDKTIYYDTKIENRGSAYLDEKLAFVNTFSNNIYDQTKEKEVFSNLAPRAGVDITNFAIADIFSPTSLVTWSTLNPTKVSDETPTVLAVDDNSTRIAMSYPISLTGTDGKPKRVVVNEVYTVRMMSTGKVNLINYQRRANETLMSDSVTVNNNSLLLGFGATAAINGKTSANRRFASFENGGNLWLTDNTGTISQIFTFDSKETHNSDLSTIINADEKGYIQGYSKSYDIDIMDVSDEGRVTFAVYGTQMAGTHAGETGIALFSYENKKLRELVFVKSDENLEKLRTLASRSYLNSNNKYYIVNNNTMYAIDTNSYSASKIVTDIPNGEFTWTADRSIIAYDGKKLESGYSTEIKLYNRQSESEHSITAGDGEIVKSIGYIGNDFVYGVADVSDITGDNVYYKRFIIMDASGNEVSRYEIEGMRFAKPAVNINDLSFTRYNKTGSGYTEVDTNKLIGKGGAVSQGYSVSYSALENQSAYRKLLYMTFANGLSYDGNVDVLLEWSGITQDVVSIE